MTKRSQQNRNELWYRILTVSAAVLAVVSAAFAVYHWTNRGICTDFSICAAISVLSVIAVILFIRRVSALKRAESLSNRPIYLVTVSGPRKKKEPKEIKGKMPPELNH